MKKLLFIVIIALFLFLIKTLPTFASDTWTVSSQPVVNIGASGSWDSQQVSAPSVIYNNGQYQMWYIGNNSGLNKLGLATSPDGTTWTKYTSNPVLDLSGDNSTINQRTVLFIDGKYKMWFGVNNNNEKQNIYYAYSTDGKAWTTPTVLFNPLPGSWEENYNASPNVEYINGTYVMYYEGNGNGSCSIGRATSPDGITWTKYGNNPVLTGGPGTCYGGPNVVYQNGQYTMYYHANFPNNNINIATSLDGINWTKSPNNPIITSTSGYDQAESPWVLNNSQMWFHQTRSDGTINIWYASLPTPTPTLPPLHLKVTPIKQYDLPSGSQVYDSANKWAPSNPTISAWGCALTSVTMVLKYFGINYLPDTNNTPLTPGSLNTWLKSQPDGYVGNGLVNWLAIPRLTKLVQLAGNNPGFHFDAVEYRRSNFADTTSLLNDLQNSQPDILEEPNHWVVATGTSGNTFTINDPYFSKSTLNDGYNNSFLSLGRYIGSHTDLSSILVVGDTSLNFSLTDTKGSAVGQQYTQSPLQDDTNPGSLSGQPVNIFYYDSPADQNYTLTITSSNPNQHYSVIEYTYDSHGNVTTTTLAGQTNNKGSAKVTVSSQKISFTTLLADLQNEYNLNRLTKNAYKILYDQAEDLQEQYKHKKTIIAKLELRVLSLLIKTLPGVKADAKSLLESDIQALL